MDPKVKEKWIKALRSGRYKQTTGHLQDREGNCCLGVLCRVLRLKRDEGYITTFFWGDENDETNLPVSLRKKLEIPEMVEGELISMNDCRVSFREIATYIEKNL